MLGKTRMEKQDRLLSLQEREDLNQRLKIRTGNKRVRARVTESRQDVSDLFGKFPVRQTITVARTATASGTSSAAARTDSL